MSNIIDSIICVPFGAVLRYIYFFVKSYGFAIILFTIVTKAIFFPLSLKSKRSMMGIQKLTPKLNELQKKYANDKEAYNRAAAELYQSEGVSPAGGCLPTLITFPIMIGLYYVIQRPLSFFFGLSSEAIVSVAKLLGETIPASTTQFQAMEISLASKAMENFDKIKPVAQQLFMVDFNFFGIPLSQTPKISNFNILWIIPILSGLTAYISNKVIMKSQTKMSGGQTAAAAAGANSVMMLMVPLMSVWFGFILPAGVGIYWITSNIVTMIQEILITEYLVKEDGKKQAQLQAEKEAREAAKKEIERERAADRAGQSNQHKKNNSGAKNKKSNGN